LLEKLSVINAKGSVLVDMANITIDLRMQVKSQNVNGSLVPAFRSSNVKINIPETEISLCVFSNCIGKSATKIKNTFMSTIRPQLVTHLQARIEDQMFQELNAAIANSYPGHNELMKDIELDWQLTTDPVLSAKSLDMTMKGLVFKENETEKDLPYGPAIFPHHRDWADSSI
jgi:hypothetical protein